MQNRAQAEANLDEFAGDELEDRAVLAMEILSCFLINEHMDDAIAVLGKDRIRRILENTRGLNEPENDTEVFEYVNAILDEYDLQ